MLKLANFQSQFINDIYQGTHDIAQYLDDNIPNIAQRIDIFKNNRDFGHLNVLRGNYPVLETVLGAEYFEQIAREYIKQYHQKIGDRSYYGADFPLFLLNNFHLHELPYLSEIAQIEYAHYYAQLAPDNNFCTLEQLSSQLANGNEFGISINSSAQIITTKYNSLEIFMAHQNEEVPEIILKEIDQQILVWRDSFDEICLKPIMPISANFLQNQETKNNFALSISKYHQSSEHQQNMAAFQIEFTQLINAGAFILIGK